VRVLRVKYIDLVRSSILPQANQILLVTALIFYVGVDSSASTLSWSVVRCASIIKSTFKIQQNLVDHLRKHLGTFFNWLVHLFHFSLKSRPTKDRSDLQSRNLPVLLLKLMILVLRNPFRYNFSLLESAGFLFFQLLILAELLLENFSRSLHLP
jgi:hypothetical protein